MICPNCQRPVDALRAPIAKIVAGKVQTFCSPECARGEKPTVPAQEAAPPPKPKAVIVEEPEPELDEAEDEAEAEPEAPPPQVLKRSAAAPVDERPRKRRVLLPAIGILVAAGIGGAIVQSVSPGRPTPAAAAPAARPQLPPPPVAPAAPAPPDKGEVLGDARALLEGYLVSTSPRLRREAALALARTKNPAALEELVKQLEAEPSPIAKIDVAEALAGAGNEKGRAHLYAATQMERRDVRFTAGVALARLGDDKARVPLRASMTIRLNRLSSAESLAMLGDPEGLRVLEEALADRDPETKMRAAAALGRAGNDKGRETLHAMLEDSHFQQMAATALARLGDPAAQPVLARALGLTALAVDAAVALRRMNAEVDPAPLAQQMAVGDEISRIETAEAVLVLFDDKATPAAPATTPKAP